MNVLIIEDDPMVEFIHRNYLEKINCFENIYSTNNVSDADDLITSKNIQLILLDIHLKASNGLEFLRHLRNQQIKVEVILITAANEGPSVQEGFHLGTLDYLIKPFTFERFEKSIQLFLEKEKSLQKDTLNQAAIDQLTYGTLNQRDTPDPQEIIEKGLSTETLEFILRTIKTLTQPFTVQDLVAETKLSHVSVRKYLRYLETSEHLTIETIYTKVGRPYKVYRV